MQRVASTQRWSGSLQLGTVDRKRLDLTVDLQELCDQLWRFGDHEALPRLPRVDLVGAGDLRFDHDVAIFSQGLDVALHGGLAPHYVVDVRIEDHRLR